MAQDTRTHLMMRVPAITSARCLESIHDTLDEVEGVANIHASVETKLVDVDIDPARISADEVQVLLAGAGFPPSS